MIFAIIESSWIFNIYRIHKLFISFIFISFCFYFIFCLQKLRIITVLCFPPIPLDQLISHLCLDLQVLVQHIYTLYHNVRFKFARILTNFFACKQDELLALIYFGTHFFDHFHKKKYISMKCDFKNLPIVIMETFPKLLWVKWKFLPTTHHFIRI